MKHILVLFTCLFSQLQGQDLKTTVQEIIDTNPIILERAKNYKATQEDIDIAFSGFYPKIDLSLGQGVEQTNRQVHSRPEESFDFSVYQNSLKYTHNLFEGFNTYHQVEAQEYRTIAAAYSYVQTVNTTTLDMVNTYLMLMQNQELIGTAQRNIDIHKEILRKMRRLYDSGFITFSDVHNIESSLALAMSDFIVQENTLMDASYNLGRVLGRRLKPSEMKKPSIDIKLPKTREKAMKIALRYNPSLLAGEYNVRLAKATKKGNESPFYPKLDIEIAEFSNNNIGGIEGTDDRFRAMAYLSYNLFNGFADISALQKSKYNLYQEQENKNSIKLRVIESLNLAWNAYEKLQEQIEYLVSYKKHSKKTLELYSKEYNLGRRSLVDVLTSQRNYIQADVQIISTEYSILYAKYRVLDSMGMLVSSILEDKALNIYESVSLSVAKQE